MIIFGRLVSLETYSAMARACELFESYITSVRTSRSGDVGPAVGLSLMVCALCEVSPVIAPSPMKQPEGGGAGVDLQPPARHGTDRVPCSSPL